MHLLLSSFGVLTLGTAAVKEVWLFWDHHAGEATYGLFSQQLQLSSQANSQRQLQPQEWAVLNVQSLNNGSPANICLHVHENSKQELLSWALLKLLTHKTMSKKIGGGYWPRNQHPLPQTTWLKKATLSCYHWRWSSRQMFWRPLSLLGYNTGSEVQGYIYIYL